MSKRRKREVSEWSGRQWKSGRLSSSYELINARGIALRQAKEHKPRRLNLAGLQRRQNGFWKSRLAFGFNQTSKGRSYGRK